MTAARLSLRRVLPRGGGLPDDQWRRRHRGIVVLLWLHVAAIPIFAGVRGLSAVHAALEGLAVAAPAIAATAARLPRRIRTLAAAVGLLTSSAVLIHLSGGLIEMHFHFFVMVAVVAMYHDWVPFLLSIVYVLVHHGLAGALDPRSVYNHPAAIADPWRWAGVHAFFIAGISAALLTYWRLNETYLAERNRAELRARRKARVMSMVNDIGRSLTGDLELAAIVQKVTDAATELTPAEFGAFFFNVDDGRGGSYRLYTLSGAPREAFEAFHMPRNTALFSATFSGDGIVRLDDVTRDPRYGQNAPHYGTPKGHLPVRSYLAAPVISRGKVLGGLFLGHPAPGRFGEEDERLVSGIAGHAAAAFEAATLFESERRSRDRLALLADASRALGASLDLESMLRELGRLVVPRLADTFVADVLDESGAGIRRVAIVADPRFVNTDIEPSRLPPPEITQQDNPIARVIRTGRTEVFREVPSRLLDAAIGDPSYREDVKRIAPTSAIIAPLQVHQRVLGTLTVATVKASGRHLGPDDEGTVEELARRAASAVENAKLFEQQRTTAEVLQHSLLPAELPDLPGISAAARYRAGGLGVEVGGDWYDAMTLQDGSIALVIGDVVGRGVAAASLMGQLKNALRAYSLIGCEPAEVLQLLNTMLHHSPTGDQMATLVYCRFDPSTGVLRVASAGHPPPLVLAPDGGARFFDEAGGMPLGALARARYSEAVAALAPGSVILLYTDGLVESRQTPLDTGMERLRANATRMAGEEIDRMCERLLADAPSGGEDDTALLALRWHALGDRIALHLPARASTLKPLRALLRRWLKDTGAREQEIYEILTAVGEAVTNVIRHASRGCTPSFEIDAERGRVLRVVIRDQGRWRPPDSARPGGQGLGIMRQFMDEVEIETADDGTAVTMTRSLATAARPT